MSKMKALDESISAAVTAYISTEAAGSNSLEDCLRAQIAAFEVTLSAKGYVIIESSDEYVSDSPLQSPRPNS